MGRAAAPADDALRLPARAEEARIRRLASADRSNNRRVLKHKRYSCTDDDSVDSEDGHKINALEKEYLTVTSTTVTGESTTTVTQRLDYPPSSSSQWASTIVSLLTTVVVLVNAFAWVN